MKYEELRNKHKLLAEWSYNHTPLDKGYSDKTLYVNVGTNEKNLSAEKVMVYAIFGMQLLLKQSGTILKMR